SANINLMLMFAGDRSSGSASVLIALAAAVIDKENAEEKADNADDQCSEKRGPKTFDLQPPSEAGADYTGQVKHQRIDQQRPQTQCEDDERACQENQQRAQHGVQQAKNQSQQENCDPLILQSALQFNSWYQLNG